MGSVRLKFIKAGHVFALVVCDHYCVVMFCYSPQFSSLRMCTYYGCDAVSVARSMQSEAKLKISRRLLTGFPSKPWIASCSCLFIFFKLL